MEIGRNIKLLLIATVTCLLILPLVDIKPIRPIDRPKELSIQHLILTYSTELVSLPIRLEYKPQHIAFFPSSEDTTVNLTIESVSDEATGAVFELNVTIQVYGSAVISRRDLPEPEREHTLRKVDDFSYTKSIIITYAVDDRTGYFGEVNIGPLPFLTMDADDEIPLCSAWKQMINTSHLDISQPPEIAVTLKKRGTLYKVDLKRGVLIASNNMRDLSELPSERIVFEKLGRLTGLSEFEVIAYHETAGQFFSQFWLERNTGVPMLVSLPGGPVPTVPEGSYILNGRPREYFLVSPILYLLGIRSECVSFFLVDIALREE